MAEENKNSEESKPPTRLQRFKEKCKGTVKFSFIFFSLIHIIKIIIAAIYYDKCPVEPDIPKYLLVMGILGVATKLITLFKDFLIKHTKVGPLLSFITTAELAILIVGSYYVYREYEPSYDPLSGDKYCNKTLYLFSFIYITIVYSLLLLCVVAVGCFVLGVLLVDKYATEKTYDVESTTEVPLPTEQEIKENK
ncbi:transmembrane protein 272-like [Tenebrio molitor]|uniref:Uncharacterized protein n=1 Tax=Tenebrio molitor TaxID=7067 RepID=A0A8J6L7F5_TENMO|nr:hypothetical protein GEV33_012245 [Tenebrio molitor]CAH1367807.1 unnamed protein product [Tenebrio molitor]